MAYTNPPTFVSGDPLAAADLNILGDDIAYLKGITDGLTFSACQVTRSAATSIANSTPTALTWTAEAYDYGGWFSSGTDLVVPAGAIPAGFTTIAVMVSARTVFASNATGYRQTTITQNGSAIATRTSSPVTGTTTDQDMGPVFLICAAGDTISVEFNQTSGGALNVSLSTLVAVRYAPVA